ncbi:helix-turn-helix transcriptional regulator [Amycolatopsis cihanbeyliensis]|uniref:DNA-binding NarL/FixJ family response regulator n=1 Tax=Amycolatopsis cihanbeyliensis TaxID=1128664 RepID=A0A542DR97_AMYCI|nr:LuxR C-terminal-related transcriptional regulator [Amycolatopsis cihanbeyliensis]TQJ05629.1 DNA-binding NarL/FixJ family response regulator [Amycolatopsis cihanbeyliensis]
MAGPLRVVLQHRLNLVRDLLAWYAAQQPGFRVVACVDRPTALLSACNRTTVDTVLLESGRTPGGVTELLTVLRELHHVRVVALYSTMARAESAPDADRLRQSGVAELVAYDDGPTAVLAALRDLGPHPVMRVPPGPRAPEPRSEPQPLIRREAEILHCVAPGLTVRQTADVLGVTERTVHSLQGQLFRKLGVRNRRSALAVALRHGYLCVGAAREDK